MGVRVRGALPGDRLARASGHLSLDRSIPSALRCSKKFFLSAGTDNLGNRHLVTRLLTTKFPLCVVLMQLAWTLHCRDLELRLDWLPRLQNRKADALTNGDFSGFSADLRIEIEPEAAGGPVQGFDGERGRAL